MKSVYFLVFFSLLAFTYACQHSVTSPSLEMTIEKPMGTADAMSTKLAVAVLNAVGGQEAWDTTSYVKWNFFGNRRLVWNKQTDDVVIEGLKEEYTIKVNLNTLEGSANYNGVAHTQPDSLKKYLVKGRDIWRNDSYWVFLPFKLRDPGTNLKYLGEKTSNDVEGCYQVEMTYKDVGKTPQNRYIISIDPNTNFINNWEFFSNATDTLPRMSTPWQGYQKYGDIFLADSRGENFVITELEVGPHLASYFE